MSQNNQRKHYHIHAPYQHPQQQQQAHHHGHHLTPAQQQQQQHQQWYSQQHYQHGLHLRDSRHIQHSQHHPHHHTQQQHQQPHHNHTMSPHMFTSGYAGISATGGVVSAGAGGGGGGGGNSVGGGAGVTSSAHSTSTVGGTAHNMPVTSSSSHHYSSALSSTGGNVGGNANSAAGGGTYIARNRMFDLEMLTQPQSQQHSQHSAASSAHSHSMLSSGSSSGRTGFDAYSHNSLYAQQNQRHLLAAGSSHHHLSTAHHAAAHALHPHHHSQQPLHPHQQPPPAALHHHQHHQQHPHYYHHAQQTPMHRPHTQIMPPMLQHIKSEPVEQITVTPSIQTEEVIIKSEPPDDIGGYHHKNVPQIENKSFHMEEKHKQLEQRTQEQQQQHHQQQRQQHHQQQQQHLHLQQQQQQQQQRVQHQQLLHEQLLQQPQLIKIKQEHYHHPQSGHTSHNEDVSQQTQQGENSENSTTMQPPAAAAAAAAASSSSVPTAADDKQKQQEQQEQPQISLTNIKTEAKPLNFPRRKLQTERSSTLPICQRCKQVFLKRQNYTQHVALSTCNIVEYDFKCSVCPMSFMSNEELQTHEQLHRLNRYFCQKYCGKFYETIEECEQHEYGQHEYEMFKCNICCISVTERHQLLVHLNEHKYQPRFDCCICRLCFQTPLELHDHYMANEDFCGKFYDKEAFKKPITSLTSPYLNKPASSELEIANTFSLKDIPPASNHRLEALYAKPSTSKTSMEPPETTITPSSSSFSGSGNEFAVLEPQIEVKTEIKVEPDFYPPMDQSDYPSYDNDYSTPDYASSNDHNFSFLQDYQDNASSSTNSSYSFSNNDAVQDEDAVCCVPKCGVNKFSSPSLQFFGFPKEEKYLSQWLHNLKMVYDPNINYSLYRICSLHFPKRCIAKYSLSYWAVPTFNLGHDDVGNLYQNRESSGGFPGGDMAKCSMPGCPSQRGETNVKFHVFPRDLKTLIKWCQNSRLPVHSKDNRFFCSRHFEEKCFGKFRLKPWAIPTLNLGTVYGKIHDNPNIYQEEKKCFLPFCRRSRSYDCNLSLYRFPRDETLLRRWCYNLRLDPNMYRGKNHKICSSHFIKEALGLRKLNPGAVPTLNLGHNDRFNIYENELYTPPPPPPPPQPSTSSKAHKFAQLFKQERDASSASHIYDGVFMSSMHQKFSSSASSNPNSNANNLDLGDVCLVPSCKRTRHSDNITLHTVPKRAEQLKKWCHNLKMDLHKMHKSVRICSAHFEKYCIGGCMRPFAVPTLELGHDDANIYRNPDVIKKLNIRETCCVKVCKRNRDRDHANLHRFPTNPELLQKWCENLHKPVPDGTKLFNDAVCEVHFEDRCLRNKRLEKWAIPTINLGWEDVPHCLPSEEEINENWVKPFAPNNGDEQGECCVSSCKRNPQIDDVKLYRPPEDAEQLVKWAHNLQVDVADLPNLKICNLHFEQHCIGKRLLNWAMPTLNLGGKVEHLFENPPPMPAIYKKKMKPDRIASNQESSKWSPRCCLPHCRKMRAVDKIHLFRFPYSNRQTLAKWCHNLQLPLVGSSHRRICSTHFEPSVLTKRCPMTLAVPTLDLNAPSGYKIYQNPARLKQIKIGAQRHCVIESCRKTKLDGVTLFRFPNNRSMLYRWRHNIKNWPKGKLSSIMRICSEHFEPHSVGTKRLSPGAIPTLKLGHESKDLYANETRSYFDLEKCVVSGCDSRKDMEDIRLFRFPRDDDELLKKWCNNLAMNPNDCVGIKICTKHFEPDCFGPRQLFKWSIPTLQLGHKEDDLVEIIHNPPPEQRSSETLFKCCVPSCGKTRKYDDAQMNSFPKNFKLFRKWKHNLKLDFLQFKEREKYKICNDHFEPVCVGKTRLNFGALPTLNLGHEEVDDLYQINPERIRPNLFIKQKDVERLDRRRLLKEESTEQMEGNDLDEDNLDLLNLEPTDVKCFVSDCSAPKSIMREPYDLPESKELRQLWSKELGNNSEENSLNEAKICGLHFQSIFDKLKAEMLDMSQTNEDLKTDFNKLQYNYQKADISLVINSYKCRVEDCATNLLNSNIRLYFFPYGKNLVNKWSHNTGIIPDENRRYMNKVCALHFESFCITENQRLRSWAIPTLNLPPSPEEKQLYKNPDLTKLDKRMLGPQILKCAVKDCNYLELVEDESLKLFNFPSDDKLLKKWCDNLKMSQHLTPLLKICSLHFEKICFGSCRLRSWAIPTLNLGHDEAPDHLNKTTIRKEVYEAEEEISEVQLKQVKIKKSLDTTKCIVPTCRKSRLKHGVRFYSLPTNVNMKRKWLHNLQIKHLKPNQKHHNIKICNLHFHKRCLEGKAIKSWAVPTMHLGHHEAVYDNPRRLRAVTNLRCMLTHCKNHTSSKAVRLFVFPKSEEFLEKWSKNLKLNIEKCKGRICFEHFEKGVVGNKKLISGAVPTLELGHEDTDIFNNKELLRKLRNRQKELHRAKESSKVKIVEDDLEEDYEHQSEDEEEELWESEEGEEEEEEDEEQIFYDDYEEEEEANETQDEADEVDKTDPQPDDDASSVTNSASDWSSIKFKELRVSITNLTPEDLMDLCSRSSYEKEFGGLKGRRSATPATNSKDLRSETPEQKSSYFSICNAQETAADKNSYKYVPKSRSMSPEQIMDNFLEPKSSERKSMSPQDPLAENSEEFTHKTNKQIESLVFCRETKTGDDLSKDKLKRDNSQQFDVGMPKRERLDLSEHESINRSTGLLHETEAINETNLRTDKALNAVAPICCLKHCGKEKTPEQHLTTYGFPKDPQLLQKWCENLGLQPEECIGRVCIDHFELRVIGSRRLRQGAVPTLNLGPNRQAKHTNLEETPQKKSVSKEFNEAGNLQEGDSTLKPPPPYKLPKPSKQSVFRLCCLKHCRRKKFLKQEKTDQQLLSPQQQQLQPERTEILYKFPTDENLRKKWFKNLRLPETLSLKTDLFICSQHFESAVIKNGKLLPLAVPTLQLSYSNRPPIYSNNPEDLKRSCLKRKPKPKVMKCLLPHCANREAGHIFLISFPEHELNSLKKWCRNLKLKYDPRKYKTAKICNEHFEPYCFFKKRNLRAKAVPTLNLGHADHVIRNCRKLRLKREHTKAVEKCCLKDCQSTNCKLYGFPRSSELRKIWCNNAQIELSLVLNNHYKICSEHFAADSFIQGSDNLKLNAVPSLNLSANMEDRVLQTTNSDESKCIVGNCQKTPSVDKVKLFKFPDKPDILKKWLSNLSLSSDTLKPHDVVCSKHFDKCCIKNGILHENAIPTQFLEVSAKGWFYKNNEDLYEVTHKCCVLDCQLSSQEAKHLYRFPKHKEDMDKWLYNLKLPQMEDTDVKDLRVCDRHFEQSCKISNKDLLTQALPTLNLGHSDTDIYGNNFIKCCLNNCAVEGFYFHKLPEDLMLQSFWFQELEMECSYNSSLYICSVHFVSFFERILEKYSAFLKESKEYVKLSVTYNELKSLPALQCFKCHVHKCSSGFKLIWKLFKFPRDKSLFNKWLHNCGLQFDYEQRLQYRICAQHFEERCLSEKKLHRWSLPTLKLPSNNSLYVNPPEALPSNHEHLQHCCVSNCVTDKGPFYKFPQKTVEQKKWIHNLDLGNQQCTLNLRVCYKHFENYCFAKAVNKIKPLKSWSVPTLRLKRKSELYLNPADKIAFYVCCIETCKQILNKSKEIYLFKFPFSNTLKQKWLHNLNICHQDYKESMRICSLHFEMHCFYKGFKALRKHSVPTLGLTQQSTDLYTNPIRRPYFKCCVNFCKASGQQLLSFPKEKPLLRKWCHNLQLNKEIQLEALRDWKICERHFEPNCFNANGSIRKLAVPTFKLGHHKKLFKNPVFAKHEFKAVTKEESGLQSVTDKQNNTTTPPGVSMDSNSLKALKKSKIVNVKKPRRQNIVKKEQQQKLKQYLKKAGEREADRAGKGEENAKEKRRKDGKMESTAEDPEERNGECKEQEIEKRLTQHGAFEYDDIQNKHRSYEKAGGGKVATETAKSIKQKVPEESAVLSFSVDDGKLDSNMHEDVYLENLLEILTESLPENDNLKETSNQEIFKPDICSPAAILRQAATNTKEELRDKEANADSGRSVEKRNGVKEKNMKEEEEGKRNTEKEEDYKVKVEKYNVAKTDNKEERNDEENFLFSICETKQEPHEDELQPSEHSDMEMVEDEIEKCVSAKGEHLISCCIKTCPNYGYLKPGLILFKLPVIHELCAQWLVNCKLSQYSANRTLKRLRICIEHFDKCCIRDNSRIIFGAVPTLHLGSKLSCKKSLNKFSHLRCCIQSCQRSAQFDHINRIPFPTGVMKRKWCKNMNLNEETIYPDDWICHRHFVRKSLIDGCKLKTGVLPTLLPETWPSSKLSAKETQSKYKNLKVIKQRCLYPCCRAKSQVLYEWPGQGACGIVWLVMQKFGSQIEDKNNNWQKTFKQISLDSKLSENLQAIAKKNIKLCGEHFYQLYKTNQQAIQDYATNADYQRLKGKVQHTFDFLNSLEKFYSKQCCVQQCRTDQNIKLGKTFKLFGFPQDSDMARKWCHNIGLEHTTLDSKPFLKVCEKHFEDHCLQRRNLLDWALPTLNLPASKDPQDIQQNDSDKLLAMSEKCFIRTCPNHETLNRNLKLYKFPKDPFMLKRWRQITNCEQSVGEPLICSLHFLANDFVHNTSQLKEHALPMFFLEDETNFSNSSPIDSNIDELIQVKQELDISEEWCAAQEENEMFATQKISTNEHLLDFKSKDAETMPFTEIKQEILEIQEEEPQTQNSSLLTINKFETSHTDDFQYSFQNPTFSHRNDQPLAFVITDIKSQIHLCCVQKCTSSSETPGISLFNQFPQDSELFIKWCFNLKIDPRNYKDNQYSICELHFEAICFTENKQLHAWSVPTLNLHLMENSFIHENDIPEYLKPSQEQCIVYGCINPLKPLFRFPYQPDISLKWFANLKLDYTDFRAQNYRICRRHFTPICFELNDSNKLTSEAVPTQFLGHTDKIAYFNTMAEEQQLQPAEALNGLLRNQDNSRGSSQGSVARNISPHDLEDHDSSYFEDFEEYYGQDD